MEQLDLTQEWDKVFPKSEKVEHCKVTFHNRYGITLAADAYVPKNAEGKLPAIAVSGPFGAVKEQSSGRRKWRSWAFSQLPSTRPILARAAARPLCSIAGHQHRGLLRSGGFPLCTGKRRPGAHWYHRYLRVGRHGNQRRGHRHPHQGHCGHDHVRLDPRDCQRLF